MVGSGKRGRPKKVSPRTLGEWLVMYPSEFAFSIIPMVRTSFIFADTVENLAECDISQYVTPDEWRSLFREPPSLNSIFTNQANFFKHDPNDNYRAQHETYSIPDNLIGTLMQSGLKEADEDYARYKSGKDGCKERTEAVFRRFMPLVKTKTEHIRAFIDLSPASITKEVIFYAKVICAAWINFQETVDTLLFDLSPRFIPLPML